jgi:hypothetical protein
MAVKNAGNTGPTKAQSRAAERDWNQRVAIANSPENLQSLATFNAAEKVRTSAQPVAATSTVPVNDPNSASNIQAQADAAQKLRDEANQTFETNRDNATREANRRETIAAVKGIFASYGLDSLYAKIESYAKLDYSASTVSLMLRETPEYAIRFPAMKALNAKQRGITEAEYIAYESSAAAYEVQYGLPKDMLKNNITGLLEAEISSAELLDRIQMASASSVSAPQELKDTLKNYYGINSGGLAGYFLDPTIAAPILQKQYNASLIGSEAMRQDVGLDVRTAEELQGLGVDEAAARTGFGTVSMAKGLTQGSGDITSNKELIDATLGGNAAAQQNVERAAKSRTARFEKGGSFYSDNKGGSGLGSATR